VVLTKFSLEAFSSFWTASVRSAASFWRVSVCDLGVRSVGGVPGDKVFARSSDAFMAVGGRKKEILRLGAWNGSSSVLFGQR